MVEEEAPVKPVLKIFLIAVLGNGAVSLSDELNLSLCLANQTVSVKIITNPYKDDFTCACQAGLANYAATIEDYVHTPVGSYKLHTNAKTWNEARKICIEENAHLAIINSYAEEAVLVEMLLEQRSSIRNIKDGRNESAFLGLHDMFKEGEWVTVFGESIRATGYSNWSKTYRGGQPDNKFNAQNCAALTYQGGMADVNCNVRYAFFCELPLSCAV